MCQTILLTDGQNGPEDARHLEAELQACAGLFQVHCRGVGTDWSPPELRRIADRLLGTAQMVATPAALADDFRATMAAAMALGVADVRLRLWMPKNVRLTGFKQGYPAEIDLLASLRPVDQRAVDLPLGAWSEGTQDYSAAYTVVPLATGEQMLVCRLSIVFPDPAIRADQSVPGANVTCTWTDDANLSARIDAQVAHYSGQAAETAWVFPARLLETMEAAFDSARTLLARIATARERHAALRATLSAAVDGLARDARPAARRPSRWRRWTSWRRCVQPSARPARRRPTRRLPGCKRGRRWRAGRPCSTRPLRRWRRATICAAASAHCRPSTRPVGPTPRWPAWRRTCGPRCSVRGPTCRLYAACWPPMRPAWPGLGVR